MSFRLLILLLLLVGSLAAGALQFMKPISAAASSCYDTYYAEINYSKITQASFGSTKEAQCSHDAKAINSLDVCLDNVKRSKNLSDDMMQNILNASKFMRPYDDDVVLIKGAHNDSCIQYSELLVL